MDRDQLPKIEAMPLDEIAALMEQVGDDTLQWEVISNRFRIIRHEGHIFGIMPHSKLAVIELALFNNPRVKQYCVVVDLLEEPNMNMFFAAAIRAKEENVKLIP